jgi:hypothetical protein
MQALNELITAAMQLAGTDDAVSHGARLWKTEGGRRCPLDWDNCSQAVYVDLKTGEHDYGEPDGPGHADCVRHCPHGMEPPPPEEEPERVEDGGDAPEEYGPTPMQPHAFGLL